MNRQTKHQAQYRQGDEYLCDMSPGDRDLNPPSREVERNDAPSSSHAVPHTDDRFDWLSQAIRSQTTGHVACKLVCEQTKITHRFIIDVS